MNAHERAYALLLRAYPPAFREAYESELRLAFRDERRAWSGGLGPFWFGILVDVIRSAPTLRLEEWRRAQSADIHHREGSMKTMAILAMVVGLVEMVNGSIELWLGGINNHDAVSLGAGLPAIAAALLLFAAGVALLRRTRNAAMLGQGAAVACMATFALIALVAPRLSMFATLLGVVFPVVLLIYLRMSRGRGHGGPMVA